MSEQGPFFFEKLAGALLYHIRRKQNQIMMSKLKQVLAFGPSLNLITLAGKGLL
jgi:hypothetical protein